MTTLRNFQEKEIKATSTMLAVKKTKRSKMGLLPPNNSTIILDMVSTQLMKSLSHGHNMNTNELAAGQKSRTSTLSY